MTSGNNTTSSGLALKALEYAISQLGQKEEPIGSNKGPMVNEYLKSVGLNPGFAWCQAFVHWCYDQAVAYRNKNLKGMGEKNPVIHTAGVLDCWNRTATNIKIMRVEAASRPELVVPGAQIFFKHGASTGHTGIVEKVEDGKIHTIEGNTNHDGSREGYEVERKVRDFTDAHLLGFAVYG